MPKTTRPLTGEQRAQRRARDREQFEQAVRALLTSDGWERWVRTRRTFRRYSLNNQLLIALQRPDATRVAGFRAWLRLNRCVRKGERAIRIFAPCTVKQRDEHGTVVLDEHGRPRTRTVFKLTAVFDVAQTEQLPNSEPVPLDPPRVELVGDSHRDLIAPLERLAAELGYRVEQRDLPEGGPGGWCDRRTRLIVVATGEPNAQLRTLVHELAHALVGETDEPFAYAYEEVIVETATYMVCQAVGLDSAGESVPYVAGWGEHGALDAVRQVAGLIDTIARRIEDTVTADHGRPAAEPADAL